MKQHVLRIVRKLLEGPPARGLSRRTTLSCHVRHGLVVCRVVLVAWGLVSGAPAAAQLPSAAAPALLMAFDGQFRDLAVCGQELTLARAPRYGEGPNATGFIRCPREGHPDYFPLADWMAEEKADFKLHLSVHVFLHTPAPLRAALRHCLRSRWAGQLFRVVTTDGIDRALVAIDAHFHLVRLTADSCTVLQRWRLPEHQINYTEAKMVKEGAFVIVSRVDGGSDDKASLYLIRPGGVQHVLDGAVALDVQPNLRDSRAPVVVATTPTITTRTVDGQEVTVRSPWLSLEVIDGARRVARLGTFRQYDEDEVMVRANADLSLIAVARFGGLLPTVVLQGEKACQATTRVLSSAGQVPTASETAPSTLLRRCSTAALTMPHR